MNAPLYAFLICLGLGIAGRILFIALSAVAKRTDLMPVTVLLDIITVCAVGGAFTAYVIVSGAVLAPYMFTAVLAGYLLTYFITKNKPEKKPKKKRPSTARRKRKSASEPVREKTV